MKKNLALAWLVVVGMGIARLLWMIVSEAMRGSKDAQLALTLIGIAVAALLTVISSVVLGEGD